MPMTIKRTPTALIILDGFGYNSFHAYNAIACADMPTLKLLLRTYPHTVLHASGQYVGLPPGQAGNSQAGHLTIGAGRIIPQPVTIINNAIADGTFFSNPVLCTSLTKLKNSNKALHIMGLVSDAGTHGTIQHLCAFVDAAAQAGIQRVFIHAFLDGRDTPPQSATTYLSALQKELNTLGVGVIGSIQGRFYAMDRDNNWERTDRCYTVLHGKQTGHRSSWQEVLATCYAGGITDEFVEPILLHKEAQLRPGDGIICTNFRPDRARQLITMLARDNQWCFLLTPFDYGQEITNTQALFCRPPYPTSLADHIAIKGLRSFFIAETEKYAHITYFIRCGREHPLASERQQLIPSIVTKNYVDYPCMSAPQITQAIIDSLQQDPYDVYFINYANLDMVGHSGNFDATVRAAACIDQQLTVLLDEFVTKRNGTLYITGDHGNAEDMTPMQGQPHTQHTTNPVYFIATGNTAEQNNVALPRTGLADIAPYILRNLV